MVIRSGGMYAARSIFAEVSLPSGSKNAFLADLPPGSVADARGKSVGGIPQGDRKTPLRQLFRSLNSWNQKNGGQKALRFLIESNGRQAGTLSEKPARETMHMRIQHMYIRRMPIMEVRFFMFSAPFLRDGGSIARRAVPVK